MHDLTARMDELLRRFVAAGDPAERKRLAAELSRLNREKVLAPRPGWNEGEWMPLPILEYSLRPEAAHGDALKQAVKSLFWMLVAGLGEPGQPAQRQFVTLFKVARSERGVTFHLACPFAEPLRFAAAARPGDADLSAEGMKRTADFTVRHGYALLEDCLVPVVVDYDRDARTVALENRNHLREPDQFNSPWLCRTTSGFLNSVGAQALKSAAQGSDAMVVSNVEAVMNQGLDEWFRWLYCLTDTGRRFEARRLLVRRSDPEEWVYDYDGEGE